MSHFLKTAKARLKEVEDRCLLLKATIRKIEIAEGEKKRDAASFFIQGLVKYDYYFTPEVRSGFQQRIMDLQKLIEEKHRSMVEEIKTVLKHNEKKRRVYKAAVESLSYTPSFNKKILHDLEEKIKTTKHKLLEGIDNSNVNEKTLRVYSYARNAISECRYQRNQKKKQEKIEIERKEEEKERERLKEEKRLQAQKIKDYVMEMKNRPCVDCGKLKTNMTFDHMKNKKFNISGSWNKYRFSTVKKEIEKCQVVCRLCHDTREYLRGRHFQTKRVPTYIIRNYRDYFLGRNFEDCDDNFIKKIKDQEEKERKEESVRKKRKRIKEKTKSMKIKVSKMSKNDIRKLTRRINRGGEIDSSLFNIK